MKKCILFIVLVASVLLVSCAPSNSNSSNSNTTKVSTGFTSEQDVKDFCRGKSFCIPSLGSRSTNNDADIVVRSYSGNTANVTIYFDFAGDKLRANFEVNKETGEYEWYR